MDTTLLRRITHDWAAHIDPALCAIDTAVTNRAGPKPNVTARTILVGLVYTNIVHRVQHVAQLARDIPDATPDDLALLGVPDPTRTPSYWQLDRYWRKIRAHLATLGADRPESAQAILDMLIPPSAGPTDAADPPTVRAIDTTLFDAYARPVKKGTVGTDPDATWRRIDRDDGTPSKLVFGYAATAIIRANGTGPEVCDHMRLQTAGAEDADTAPALVAAVQKTGAPIDIVVVDRGFSQKPERVQAPIRRLDVEVIFDLKSNDRGVSGTFRGAPIIDGWPHAPSIPRRLHNLTRAAPGATREERDKIRALFAERERWAYPPHATPQPGRARITSPARRGRIRCRHVPESTQHPDPTLPTCRTKHPPTEACGIGTLTYTQEAAPRTWQWPRWGSPDWEHLYKRRSAVERYFANLKSETSGNLRPGAFRLRGLTNVALCLAIATITTNLVLRYGRNIS